MSRAERFAGFLNECVQRGVQENRSWEIQKRWQGVEKKLRQEWSVRYWITVLSLLIPIVPMVLSEVVLEYFGAGEAADEVMEQSDVIRLMLEPLILSRLKETLPTMRIQMKALADEMLKKKKEAKIQMARERREKLGADILRRRLKGEWTRTKLAAEPKPQSKKKATKKA